MQIDGVLYRNSILLFAIVSAVIVWGFWPSYYAHPWQLPSARYYVHGVLMTAWLVMLLAQAYLIRSNRRSAHRTLGKASFVLAPLIVAMFVIMIHGAAAAHPGAGALQQIFLFYVLGAAFLFAFFYALAIVYRKTPATHARFMACTVFPIYTAGTDRIAGQVFPGANPLLVPPVAWAVGDVLLLALVIWDWQSRRRIGAFAVALALLVAYQSLTAVAPLIPGWLSFTEWFAGL
jgi:hypothetical protein